MNILEYANNNLDELLDRLKTLVNIPSVLKNQPENLEAPFGDDVRRSLDVFLDMAKNDGFDTLNVGNVAGVVEYKSDVPNAETLGILCHLDVVPAPNDGWITPPFEADIRDGKMYGRGTADDKGPLLASYYALKAIKDEGIKLNKNVRIIVGTDEESGSRCLHHYLSVEKEPEIGFSPDADFPVIYGEKGIASFNFNGQVKDKNIISIDSGDVYNVVPDKASITSTLNLKKEFEKFLKKNGFEGSFEEKDGAFVYTMFGKRAHAMNPSAGINALYRLSLFAKKYFKDDLLNFIAKYFSDPFGKKLGVSFYDPEMKYLTINLANYKQTENKSRAGINIRYPVNFPFDEFVSVMDCLAKKNNLEFETLSNSVPHFVPKDSSLVKTLMQAYQHYTGDLVSEPITIGGGTYARDLSNAVAFGLLMPGEEDVMHQANEYVKIDNLKLGVCIYYDAIMGICK